MANVRGGSTTLVIVGTRPLKNELVPSTPDSSSSGDFRNLPAQACSFRNEDVSYCSAPSHAPRRYTLFGTGLHHERDLVNSAA